MNDKVRTEESSGYFEPIAPGQKGSVIEQTCSTIALDGPREREESLDGALGRGVAGLGGGARVDRVLDEDLIFFMVVRELGNTRHE